RQGMLFAGTGHGFFYSLDDGGHWAEFRDGLPAAPVTWIAVPRDFHDVVVSTYGRGLFILHDITRLEQSDRVASGAPVFLYEPKPGFRQARRGGVDFLYSLRSAPKGAVKFEVLDAAGTVVRTSEADARAGLNRASWNLRYDPPIRVGLRAK